LDESIEKGILKITVSNFLYEIRILLLESIDISTSSWNYDPISVSKFINEPYIKYNILEFVQRHHVDPRAANLASRLLIKLTGFHEIPESYLTNPSETRRTKLEILAGVRNEFIRTEGLVSSGRLPIIGASRHFHSALGSIVGDINRDNISLMVDLAESCIVRILVRITQMEELILPCRLIGWLVIERNQLSLNASLSYDSYWDG
jgi:hypothetical protein